MQWRDILIDHYDLLEGAFRRALFYRCFFCGAEALYILRRISNLTDNSYVDFVCAECAAKWGKLPE